MGTLSDIQSRAKGPGAGAGTGAAGGSRQRSPSDEKASPMHRRGQRRGSRVHFGAADASPYVAFAPSPAGGGAASGGAAGAGVGGGGGGGSSGLAASSPKTGSGRYRLADFELLHTAGVGTFGRVYSAVHKGSGLPVALKAQRRRRIEQCGMQRAVVREREVLSLLAGHPFVVQLLGTFVEGKRLFFVLEHLPVGGGGGGQKR